MIQTDITGETSFGGLYTDIKGSRDWALSSIAGWASQLDWSQADQESARADIEAAFEDADDAAWFGYDPATFWQSLADAAESWPNGDMLAPIWVSAGATVSADIAQSYDWEGFADDSIADAAAGIETLEDVANAGAKAAKMPWVWGVGAGVAALGLASYLLL